MFVRALILTPSRILTVALLAATLGLTPAARAVSYFDGVFNDSDWTATKILDTTGGSASFVAGQVAAGGNPNEYRQVMHTYGFGAIIVGHLRNGATVDPASCGGIQSVDFSFDAINIDPPFNFGVAFSPLIYQGGQYYEYFPRPGVFANAWTNFSFAGLVATDFTLVGSEGAGSNPDFSASGGIMQFGYESGNSNPTPGTVATRTGGIDNWHVDVTCVPEPASLALLAIGALLTRRR